MSQLNLCRDIHWAWSCLFLTSLWFVGCFFLLGDLGWWNDDYFVSQLNPVTGEVAGYTLRSPSPFRHDESGLWIWRPALTIGVTNLLTFCWHSPWMGHLVIALLHLACGFATLEFGRMAGLSHQASLIAASLYVVWPSHFEVAFWPNGFLVGAGLLWLLLSAICYSDWIRTGDRLKASLCALCGMFTLLNHEIPGGAIIAMPFVYFIMRDDVERPHTRRWRWLMPLLVIAGLYIAYAALRFATQIGVRELGLTADKPTIMRWAGGSYLRSCAQSLTLRHFGKGAFQVGLDTLAAHPIRTSFAVCAVAICVCFLARHWRCWQIPGCAVRARTRRHWIRTFVIVLLIGSILPIAALAVPAIRPRYAAPIVLVVALIIATLADAVMNTQWRLRHGISHALTALWLIACLFGSVCMVGVQRIQQTRARMDETMIASMRRAIADPPPNAVIVPVWCDDWPANTGSLYFDSHFNGPLWPNYAAPVMGKHIWGRQDVSVIPLPLWLSADRHFVELRALIPADAPNLAWNKRRCSTQIATDRLIVVRTLGDGSLQFMTHLHVIGTASEADLVLPATSHLLEDAYPDIKTGTWTIDIRGAK